MNGSFALLPSSEKFSYYSPVGIKEFIIKKFFRQISVKRLLQFHDLTNV